MLAVLFCFSHTVAKPLATALATELAIAAVANATPLSTRLREFVLHWTSTRSDIQTQRFSIP
jgi:hypothetical protein